MPRHATLTDDELLDRLLAVFRELGYEGASMALIAESTGLQKASLYHRFPGGKQQMAEEVAARVARRFAVEILAPAGDTTRSIERRVQAIAAGLAEFYEQGSRRCLLDVFTIGHVSERTAATVAAAAEAWIGAFAGLSRQCGATPAIARRRAETAVASIEGALVLAHATGSTAAFRRALNDLPAQLCGTQTKPAKEQ